jgi:aspartate carbamoyltransferase catalytic subunit
MRTHAHADFLRDRCEALVRRHDQHLGLELERAERRTLADTARNLEAMRPDAIVVRHPSSGAPHVLARAVSRPVINAGDGQHEHPTQALLDLFTIREKKGRIAGLDVAIVGDILHSRVARSNLFGLCALGAKVRLVGPPTLLPAEFASFGVAIHHDLKAGITGADVIMMLRIQRERQGANFFPSLDEYSRLFGLDRAALAAAKPDVVILHPGPMNRGVEISSEVADGPYSLILDQVTNGVAVRMALLYLFAARGRTRRRDAEEGSLVTSDAIAIEAGISSTRRRRRCAVRSAAQAALCSRWISRGVSLGGGGAAIDARGCWVMPGLIDLHCHLRDGAIQGDGRERHRSGGQLHRGRLHGEHESRQRQRGGDAVHPRARREGALAPTSGGSAQRARSRTSTRCRKRTPPGCLDCSEMFTLDSVVPWGRSFDEYCAMFDIPIIDHAEDPGLAGGAMHEGRTSIRLGLRGIPAAAEEVMVSRDIALAELTGGRLHVAHASTRGTVERCARRALACTSPPKPRRCFTLTDRRSGNDGNAKMNPPLRSGDDRRRSSGARRRHDRCDRHRPCAAPPRRRKWSSSTRRSASSASKPRCRFRLVW